MTLKHPNNLEPRKSTSILRGYPTVSTLFESPLDAIPCTEKLPWIVEIIEREHSQNANRFRFLFMTIDYGLTAWIYRLSRLQRT
jgi:hypothetical protein